MQTFAPQHYAIQHAQAHDFHGFYAEEIAYRKHLSAIPPLCDWRPYALTRLTHKRLNSFVRPSWPSYAHCQRPRA